MESQISATIEKIRPALQADGGDIKFISVDKNGIVKVELQGRCGGCPMAQMTLKNYVERVLKAEVPGVKEVVSIN